ncbi:MAG: lamin tail domain-containing protein, partial [Myxococcota bacterium]|nr:lamin tail domain-containing protein [Myxococcota bacterium]
MGRSAVGRWRALCLLALAAGCGPMQDDSAVDTQETARGEQDSQTTRSVSGSDEPSMLRERTVSPAHLDRLPIDGATLTVDSLAEGDLVITEVMVNPEDCGDWLGEYFEVWNATGYDVDLKGLQISDDEDTSEVED